jgi:hypothetical protein
MNEFSAVSAEELDKVEGGIGLIPAIVALVVDGGRTLPGLDEPGEVLPGFDNFLAETRRISGR